MIVSTIRSKLVVTGCVLALGLSLTNAALASLSTGNPTFIMHGDDNGPGAVYGLPPLVPQGDDNGPGAVYGLPPLVPQSQEHGT